MVGKLIVHAADRPRAIEAAKAALATLRIEGVRTTVPLHLRILEHPDFVRGAYDVQFLERTGLAG
jgi:acetyl-CoA carboxylase biotin carboxylase subunit